MIDDSGRPDFNLLQNFRGEAARIHYYIFDLLCCNNRDLTRLPLVEWRALLIELRERLRKMTDPELLRFGQGAKSMKSRKERVCEFHSKTGFADLWGIRRRDAGELRSDVVDDVEIAVGAVVIPQAQIGADCLTV
jgi:hypothetical protein